MRKHTEGEWEARPEGQYVCAQVWGNGQILAEVYGYDRATRQANAELIAAAPEMLKQLEALIEQLDASNFFVVPPNVRAVIDRARGRA